MMTQQTRGGADPTDKVERVRDTRRYWRVGLAVAAPIPMLAMGVVNLLMPVAGDADFSESVTQVAAHTGRVAAAQWVGLLFFAFLIPAVLAVWSATRRIKPRLAAVGGTLCLIGFGVGFSGGPNDSLLAYLTATEHLDVATMARLDDAGWAMPAVIVSSLLFLVGLVVGLAVLGTALLRSKVAPAWMGIALIVGGATHPFIPGRFGVAAGLLVAAVGFAGASLALLRTPDDEFDLPATGLRLADHA